MILVLDTSVVAKVFIAEPDRDIAMAVLSAGIRGEATLLAPSLLLYELNNVLISKAVKGDPYSRAITVLMDWIGSCVLQLQEPDENLLRGAEAIASIDTQGQGHISSFDATFHALALMRRATFLTSDHVYVRKAKPLLGSVELLRDFKI
jgi:predicted nucleic acid-binding protein